MEATPQTLPAVTILLQTKPSPLVKHSWEPYGISGALIELKETEHSPAGWTVSRDEPEGACPILLGVCRLPAWVLKEPVSVSCQCPVELLKGSAGGKGFGGVCVCTRKGGWFCGQVKLAEEHLRLMCEAAGRWKWVRET